MGLAIKHNGKRPAAVHALQKSKVSPSSLNQVSLFFSIPMSTIFLLC